MIGRHVSHYIIEEHLGSGGMGEVYKGFDQRLKRTVAIKRLQPGLATDAEYRRRFVREAQNAAQISHHGIAAVFDIVEEGDELLLVMEYVEGETLQASNSESWEINTFLKVAKQCVEALASAHLHGLIHRDIKPGNIMLDTTDHVKILDFGLAKRRDQFSAELTDSDLTTKDGRLRGTPAYMAPEVLLGKPATTRSDIFSLGVVFYEALAGKHPFLDRTLASTSHRIISELEVPVIRVNPRVPDDLGRVVSKMLAKDPDVRYASAQDVLADLRRISRSYPFTPPDFLPPEPPGFWERYRTIALAALVTLVVLVVFAPQLNRQWQSLIEGGRLSEVKQTVAVLPFESSSGDASVEAFGRGLRTVVTDRLEQLSLEEGFSIVPAELFQNRTIEQLSEVPVELGAALAVKTDLKHQAGYLTITFSLVSVEGEESFGSHQIEGRLTTARSLEASMTEGILDLFGVEPTPGQRRQIVQFGTRSKPAYHFYLRGLGRLLAREKDPVGATGDFEKALGLDRSFARAECALGEANLARYREDPNPAYLEAARERCSAVNRHDPEDADALTCLGKLENEEGNLAEAVGLLEKAHRNRPLDMEVTFLLDDVYLRREEPEQVEMMYESMIAAKPGVWWPYSGLYFYYDHYGSPAEVIESAKQLLEVAPDYARAHNAIGASYARLWCWAEALPALEKARDLKADGSGSLNLAAAYFFQGRFREAIEEGTAAIVYLEKQDPGSRDYLEYGNLAEFYFWIPGEDRTLAVEHSRRAIEYVEEFLSEEPEDWEALGNLALYQAISGDLATALETLDRALQGNPSDAENLLKGAQIRLMRSEPEAALDLLSRALEAGLNVRNVLHHPAFTQFRDNPVFQELVRRFEHTEPCP